MFKIPMHIAIRKISNSPKLNLDCIISPATWQKIPIGKEKKKGGGERLRKNNKISQTKGWGHDSVGNGSDPKHPVRAGVLFQQWATTPTLSQPLQGAGFMETG